MRKSGSIVGASDPQNARKYQTFSKEHREQLAMGGRPKRKKPRGGANKAKITVVVRKRPVTPQEAARCETDILAVDPTCTTATVEEPRKNVHGTVYMEPHTFTFDRVYPHESSNLEVYRSCVKPLVNGLFRDGARCSCFAYGQTGSGKTYTMVGPSRLKVKNDDATSVGIWELAGIDIFRWLSTAAFDYSYGLYVSFYEIYCNKVYDLLNDRKLVRALETKSANVVVKDCTITKAENIDALLEVISIGLEKRTTGSNSKNAQSSRGHAILTMEIRNEHSSTTHGKLAFVDLAGSERGADTLNSQRQTQTDGAGINRSLLALKECIRALDSQSDHVPFRDTELTKILRDMFIGSRARTLMIANVSPASGCCEQTLNTVRYAERVKALRNNCKPDIDDVAQRTPMGRGEPHRGASATLDSVGSAENSEGDVCEEESESSEESDGDESGDSHYRRGSGVLGQSQDESESSDNSGSDDESSDADSSDSEYLRQSRRFVAPGIGKIPEVTKPVPGKTTRMCTSPDPRILSTRPEAYKGRPNMRTLNNRQLSGNRNRGACDDDIAGHELSTVVDAHGGASRAAILRASTPERSNATTVRSTARTVKPTGSHFRATSVGVTSSPSSVNRRARPVRAGGEPANRSSQSPSVQQPQGEAQRDVKRTARATPGTVHKDSANFSIGSSHLSSEDDQEEIHDNESPPHEKWLTTTRDSGQHLSKKTNDEVPDESTAKSFFIPLSQQRRTPAETRGREGTSAVRTGLNLDSEATPRHGLPAERSGSAHEKALGKRQIGTSASGANRSGSYTQRNPLKRHTAVDEVPSTSTPANKLQAGGPQRQEVARHRTAGSLSTKSPALNRFPSRPSSSNPGLSAPSDIDTTHPKSRRRHSILQLEDEMRPKAPRQEERAASANSAWVAAGTGDERLPEFIGQEVQKVLMSRPSPPEVEACATRLIALGFWSPTQGSLKSAKEEDLHDVALKLSVRMRELFAELIQSQQDCMRFEIQLNQRLIPAKAALQKNDTLGAYELDIDFLDIMRPFVQQKLGVYIHLGMRMWEMEEFFALSRTVNGLFQKISANNVDIYSEHDGSSGQQRGSADSRENKEFQRGGSTAPNAARAHRGPRSKIN